MLLDLAIDYGLITEEDIQRDVPKEVVVCKWCKREFPDTILGRIEGRKHVQQCTQRKETE